MNENAILSGTGNATVCANNDCAWNGVRCAILCHDFYPESFQKDISYVIAVVLFAVLWGTGTLITAQELCKKKNPCSLHLRFALSALLSAATMSRPFIDGLPADCRTLISVLVLVGCSSV